MRYDPSARYPVEIFEREYRRADGEGWLARICQPQGPGPFPALLYVHGGQWSFGTRMNNHWVYEPLAESGVVVVAIDFRLAPDHPYPEPLADINYATRWAKAHAGDFNADPRSLGGLGCSSGGHQLMLSAMQPDDPRYAQLPFPEPQHLAAGEPFGKLRAGLVESTSARPSTEPVPDASLAYVVGCWPILDPHARYLFAQDTGREDIVARTEGYFRTVEATHEGNPQHILDRGERVRLPPTLIIQGTADRNVTPEIQQRFAAAFQRAGGQCQLEIFPGMPHGTTVWPPQETQQALELIKAFIARQVG